MKKNTEICFLENAKQLKILSKAIWCGLRSIESARLSGAFRDATMTIITHQIDRLCKDAEKLKSQLEETLCHE
ncbi:MAG: hypothetical protein A3I12_00420 [Gammaproteobacteria bacterium RIFCSPLOWO2_02_FULL_38_11]|nr:MAG: hypothetical protein A2W47_07620 [Gammaproteobacteria bacterium RIFCSPHIGHO2_12_38_15]OGT68605.1 MAG: hypothetical protein A3I12_00420 [Gammaproteobacteria bacterium RIFCSPLOWO2_02_FULL_38_11]OGT75387.1 MAG: hypothetical protein A3G71_02960 [Gammaproteobacteria bacterium RIFCSPLOWO2_12_FULL_38_14]